MPMPHRRNRRTWMLAVAGAAAVLATTATMLPIFAGSDALTLVPVADTTLTQVPQDGDTAVKTTLASCPAVCDGNPNGRRDATLQFAVDKLPVGAKNIRATLRVYAWHDAAARILARGVPGVAVSLTALGAASNVQAADGVKSGYNDFDMSSTITQNGTYTFGLAQESLNTRVYWASKENSNTKLRPELVLSYTAPSSGPSGPAPSATTADPGNPGNPGAPGPAPSSAPATVKPSVTVSSIPLPTKTAPVPSDPNWRLVWSDEFTGSTIDKSKWNLRNNEGRDIDLGCNVSSPKNSFVSGGNLTLRALREQATCSGQTRQYTQAYLDTIGKSSWTYGKFEMRAKSPNKPNSSQGLWPAFWLRPDDGGNGEIDVTELPGGASWYDKSTAAIFWDYTPVKQDTRLPLPAGGYPGDGFHKYTTEWDQNSLRWYLDDKLVWSRDRSTTPFFDKAFNKPYNIRLNFQVGGWLGSPDAATAFPADFVVDYVRVYQR
jgi:beta-glucanase (GH16 family)